MNDFNRVNELVKIYKAKLNALYDDENSQLVKKGLEICGFNDTKSAKIAVLRRIVDLKIDPLMQEFKRLGYDENRQILLRDEMYEFVREIHEKMHQNLIDDIQNEGILNKFYLQVLKGVHEIGVVINEFQKSWQKLIIDTNNKNFQEKFSNMAEAQKFIKDNELFQKTPHQEPCDRSYGVVVKDGEKYSFKPYAAVFKDDSAKLKIAFENLIQKLDEMALTSDEIAYVTYFTKLKNAFLQEDNDLVIASWREAEMAWMEIKSPLQIGHPLEYYEDAYTHAVALEWDIRLSETSSFDAQKFKNEVKQSFENVYEKISANNEIMKSYVFSNIDKTQLYISTPMVYYGADLNGLFSAQVVPNDEFVSINCGKKIFAFVNFVYESAKARPFMRLSSEIFDLKYLNYGREILFKKRDVWRKVYEISTIGHEFGHIFFIDEDTEKRMNKSGVFKFIEEYKATTGGLINFFFNETPELRLPVFDELIRRSVGLISWQKDSDVRAYYCEALIHLTLLFKAEVLKFDAKKLLVDFSLDGYERFKILCQKNYENLAKIYANKADASEFLNKFCEFCDGIYLPSDDKTREFVKFYYARYEQIGNETDSSNEREKWINA